MMSKPSKKYTPKRRRPDSRKPKLAYETITLIRLKKGGTISNKTCQLVFLKTGWMVSAYGHEVKLSGLRKDKVDKYLQSKRRIEQEFRGAWKDGGIWYLDVSEQVGSQLLAIVKGNMNKQKAIWNNQAGKEETCSIKDVMAQLHRLEKLMAQYGADMEKIADHLVGTLPKPV